MHSKLNIVLFETFLIVKGAQSSQNSQNPAKYNHMGICMTGSIYYNCQNALTIFTNVLFIHFCVSPFHLVCKNFFKSIRMFFLAFTLCRFFKAYLSCTNLPPPKKIRNVFACSKRCLAAQLNGCELHIGSSKGLNATISVP